MALLAEIPVGLIRDFKSCQPAIFNPPQPGCDEILARQLPVPGELMTECPTPRFPSREIALRFYFRANDLLTDSAKPGTAALKGLCRSRGQPNLASDFLILDRCFRGMTDFQLWLLAECFGPACFKIRRPSISELLKGARIKFPAKEWTARGISRIKRDTLDLFESRLNRAQLM